MTGAGRAYAVLAASTLAFGVCFAVWMMNGVLVTFLVANRVFEFDQAQIGWLIGLPVLTGSVLRLPAGLLTDRFGGRPVFVAVMLASAAAAWLTSFANGFWAFAAGGLAFGLAGASFAVGIAYVSLFFSRERQGTALGLFGMGTTGAAATALFAPRLLERLTAEGARLEAWRLLPRYYAALLVLATIAFWLLTTNRRPHDGAPKSLAARLAPLKAERVWRFGLYYLLVFGGFVALSQWLIPYYVNVYGLAVASAGALAAAFSFPSGLFRAVGGWLSDRHGPRKVMYGVLSGCAACTLLLAVPRMDVYSPGEGVMAAAPGTVEEVSPNRVVVAGTEYRIRERGPRPPDDRGMLVWPRVATWHEPAVQPGDDVARRQLVARGVTHVYFQANRTIFTGILLALGLFMGIGMGAVYKYIPSYFPQDVGVVGGLVGVIGGLGGFVLPILFGYLLKTAGLWTTCWLILFALSLVCLGWMLRVVQRLMAAGAPQLAREIETPQIARHLEELAHEMENLAAKLRRYGAA
jgi:NNP family nitrate/nitrite transporter-like MFS transporter